MTSEAFGVLAEWEHVLLRSIVARVQPDVDRCDLRRIDSQWQMPEGFRRQLTPDEELCFLALEECWRLEKELWGTPTATI